MSDSIVTLLNSAGDGYSRVAVAMLIQSSVLILMLYGLDLLLRKHVRAIFRYAMWMLVLVKLVLPPTLALPTSIGYWAERLLPARIMNPEPETTEELATQPQGPALVEETAAAASFTRVVSPWRI